MCDLKDARRLEKAWQSLFEQYNQVLGVMRGNDFVELLSRQVHETQNSQWSGPFIAEAIHVERDAAAAQTRLVRRWRR